MAKRVARLRFELRPCSDGWGLFGPDGGICSSLWHKRDAVQYASQELARAWEDLRIRSELVIKRRDGSIQDCRTYGKDPRRSRG